MTSTQNPDSTTNGPSRFDDIAAVEALIGVAIDADWQYHEVSLAGPEHDVSIDAETLWEPLLPLLEELHHRRLDASGEAS